MESHSLPFPPASIMASSPVAPSTTARSLYSPAIYSAGGGHSRGRPASMSLEGQTHNLPFPQPLNTLDTGTTSRSSPSSPVSTLGIPLPLSVSSEQDKALLGQISDTEIDRGTETTTSSVSTPISPEAPTSPGSSETSATETAASTKPAQSTLPSVTVPINVPPAPLTPTKLPSPLPAGSKSAFEEAADLGAVRLQATSGATPVLTSTTPLQLPVPVASSHAPHPSTISLPVELISDTAPTNDTSYIAEHAISVPVPVAKAVEIEQHQAKTEEQRQQRGVQVQDQLQAAPILPTVALVTTQPVVVTGAAGFIASHIIKQLLEKGYRVRGTVRNVDDAKNQILKRLDPTGSRLELLEADLMSPGSFDSVIFGCEYVIHTASPFTIDIKSVQHDLVDPAVRGTENVLTACRKSGTVRRFIFTSSIMAIEDHPEKNHVFTESDWNNKSSMHHNPYSYSKVLSEKTVWDFVSQIPIDERFEAIAINPSMVIGPSLSPDTGQNESNQLIAQIMTNKIPGIFKIGWNIVDVRDVARAHILAMENPLAQGRYIVSNESIWMKDLVARLKNQFPDYKYPKRNLKSKPASMVVYLASYFRPRLLGSMIRSHLGTLELVSNEKAKGSTLGLEFTPIDRTLHDTVTSLQQFALIPRH